MCKKPEIVVFAGPNGSGKSTVTGLAQIAGSYVNADNIKANLHCTDLEAARTAEALREEFVSANQPFTFETVLSTDRNLLLLRKAKDAGFFIRGIYVLTSNPQINIARVRERVKEGGHGVPEDKIVSRYHKALSLLPEFIELCDICHIYDNTDTPYRIFKKRKSETFIWESPYWTESRIKELVSRSEKSAGQGTLCKRLVPMPLLCRPEDLTDKEDLGMEHYIDLEDMRNKCRVDFNDEKDCRRTILYEVVIPEYVDRASPEDIYYGDIVSCRELGSLFKVLHPDSPNFTGSGYWVEGAVLGGELVIGADLASATEMADYRSWCNCPDVPILDRQIFSVFFETDRGFEEEGYIVLPQRHIVSKIPLGTVHEVYPDC